MFALLYLFHHGAAIHNRKMLLGLIIKTCFFFFIAVEFTVINKRNSSY